MQCSTVPRFLNYTTDRVRRHQRLRVAEESIIPARSDQTNAVGRCHPPEHLTATARPGFPPNIAKSMGRAHSTQSPGCQCQVSPTPVSGASAMTSASGNRVASAKGGTANVFRHPTGAGRRNTRGYCGLRPPAAITRLLCRRFGLRLILTRPANPQSWALKRPCSALAVRRANCA
jgi:hypothetical protein